MIYTFVDTLLGFRDSRKFENLWETRKINVPSVRRVTSYVTLTFKFKFKDNEINEKTERFSLPSTYRFFISRSPH